MSACTPLSEDNLGVSVFSFHHLSPKDGTRNLRLGAGAFTHGSSRWPPLSPTFFLACFETGSLYVALALLELIM